MHRISLRKHAPWPDYISIKSGHSCVRHHGSECKSVHSGIFEGLGFRVQMAGADSHGEQPSRPQLDARGRLCGAPHCQASSPQSLPSPHQQMSVRWASQCFCWRSPCTKAQPSKTHSEIVAKPDMAGMTRDSHVIMCMIEPNEGGRKGKINQSWPGGRV